jgi:outer membrane translocation and assembly module TamA
MVKNIRFLFKLWFGGLVFMAGILLVYGPLYGQASADGAARNTSYFALPLVFSNPESGVGVGAGFLTRFYWGGDSLTRESNVQLGGAYTTKEQILSYAFYQIFTPKSQQYFYGELGFYDFNYLYYGQGNNTQLNQEEVFFFDLFRLRFSGLQRVFKQHYAGLRWFYDYWDIKEIASGGILEANMPLGTQGGVSSSLGFEYLYDSRNDVFYPSQGKFLEFAFMGQNRFTGGDFEYLRFTSSCSFYRSFKEKTILAVNFKTDWLRGQTAFFDLPQLGGLNNLRGYYLGRFRENYAQLLQVEIRQPVWGRFKAVAFAGAGNVSATLDEALQNNLQLAGGAGVRFQILKNSQANIRLDLAWGDGPLQVYVGVGEAF